MADIDKIYGTDEQYEELFYWLNDNRPQYLRYLYPRYGYIEMPRPISNFSKAVDIWLYKNCPLLWVVSAIKAQYH